MKKILTFVGAVIVAIGLSACGATESPAQPTKTVTATPSPSDNTDEQFVQLIRANTNDFDVVSPGNLVGLAHEVCNQVAGGISLADLGNDFIDHGFDPTDAGFFIGASTAAYCPQYITDLKSQSSELTNGSGI